jgi:hypothetical protein
LRRPKLSAIEGSSVPEEKIQVDIIGGYYDAKPSKRPHKLNYLSI